ncbi:MAG: hypothetical protein NZM07_04170 [Elioraea sp.]|nr:hypothetical protein [Elioraea sp.]
MTRSASPVRLTRLDATGAMLVVAIFMAFAWHASGVFDDALWQTEASQDVYFHSDTYFFFEFWQMGAVLLPSSHAAHPWLGLLILGLKRASVGFGFRFALALRALLTASAGLSGALLYLLARGIGTSSLAALIGTLSVASTAAFTHWVGAIDHFALSIGTIGASFALLAASATTSAAAWTGAAALAGSITITNLVAGALSVAARSGAP